MANRILILTSEPRADGGEAFNVLVLYQVNPLITVGQTGEVYVHSHSNTLPEIVDEYDMASPQQKAQLNSGAWMFEERTIRKPKGMTKQELLDKLEVAYDRRKAAVIANLRRRFEYTGDWVNF
jgi:hypothetical protein